MRDTWTTRELPVLNYLVERLDDVDAERVGWDEIGPAIGMPENDVRRALLHLSNTEPPYLVGMDAAEFDHPVIITNTTERARREVGAWPTPENLIDRLVQAMEHAAEDEPDPERKSRMKQIAGALGGGLRDFAVQVDATVVTRPMG